MTEDSCCSPARSGTPAVPPATSSGRRERPGTSDALVVLAGGEFLMGTDDPEGYPADQEGPVRAVRVAPFAIGRFALTNERFAEFVADTGHVTDAQRYGWSFVFHLLLPDQGEDLLRVAQAPWWRQVHGADWAHPEGAGSGIEERLDHPVVHVSRRDAEAYCDWAGLRLPTEAEWEYAARGGLVQARFPWGDELEPGGEHRMNVWQGSFPDHNTRADGWLGTCPVDSFEPNGYGLHCTSGNVWEWCAGDFLGQAGVHPIRGGSYLCHSSYCNRYRVAARSSNTTDASTGNTGLRCAADVDLARLAEAVDRLVAPTDD